MGKRYVLVLCLLLVAAPVRSQTVLVLPFENSSDTPALEWLGPGLAELSAERLPGDARVVISHEEWLAAVEKFGLPATGRFTRATMLKLAAETDADFVVFGSFSANNGKLTLTAQVLRRDPPGLSVPMVETGAMDDLMLLHARLAWQVLRYVDPVFALSQPAYVERQARLRLDAFEQFIRGMLDARDDQRLRYFREAARLEPDWGDPAFALGQAYFAQRDWATALIWLSRVPPAHSRGLEASFLAGVCHLFRNDMVRAESALSDVLAHAEFPEVLNNLGVARMRLGKTREAVAHWQRATELDPEETDYWFNLGLGALRSSDAAAVSARDFGVRAFREVLRGDPQDAEARALLIAALERGGRMTEAAAEREASPAALPTTSPSASPFAALRITARHYLELKRAAETRQMIESPDVRPGQGERP
jgi:tetratricopeptide (TPR) repeat protein